MRSSRFLLSSFLGGILLSLTSNAADPAPLAPLQAQASRYHAVLAVPTFERTPEELRAAADRAIADAETALGQLARQDLSHATFASTIGALDAITGRVSNTDNRIGLIKETHIDKATRDAASEMSVKLESWAIGLDYRENVYRVIKAYADTHPVLNGEDKLLFDEVLRDYRRAGLSLPAAERSEIERLRKELTKLTTEFGTHINEARAALDFTAAELEGVPQSFLESPGVRQPDGRYRVMANITWHAQAIGDNAVREETRRLVHLARNQLAMADNVPLLARIVALRTDIARRLGYATWADYQTEPRMAKTGAAARKFEEDLVTGLQPKFTAELAELQRLKAAEIGRPDARLEPWDINYYTNQLKKQRYTVDAEQLRAYFPYQNTLAGMFRIYERIFGLKFTEVAPPYVWAPGVQLFAVNDADTGEPFGLFYLDMFPRDGKYNHFACFTVSSGERLANGDFECPVASLECNFPPPSGDTPSLLKHEEAETLFHEFGHVMHCLLSRAKFMRHYAFGVPQDFVEAPSQMLENWVWDKAVLDTFAADYRDPTKKVPAEIIDALQQARKATAAVYYRRQLAFGLLDLALHTQTDASVPVDVLAITNGELARVSFPPAPGTAFVAYFGHIAGGYDAGYYGYLWSLAIAQDMASVFRAAPGGFLDPQIGRRLRNEIYGVGASRDVADSVQRFLGRPQSLQPFLRFVGIE
ncbi:MAG TPA: M3 family metallopeptidase [Opitutaceae bacterium]|nr:M3 family metallopeptidase [Opitutaceae bacterium]